MASNEMKVPSPIIEKPVQEPIQEPIFTKVVEVENLDLETEFLDSINFAPNGIEDILMKVVWNSQPSLIG